MAAPTLDPETAPPDLEGAKVYSAPGYYVVETDERRGMRYGRLLSVADKTVSEEMPLTSIANFLPYSEFTDYEGDPTPLLSAIEESDKADPPRESPDYDDPSVSDSSGGGKEAGGESTTTNTSAADFKRVGDFLRASPLAMPGYGQIFVNDENPDPTSEVWYVGGDGDEPEFGDLVEGELMGIGAKSVRYEAEGFPPRDRGWVMVYPDRKAWTENAYADTVANCNPGQLRGADGKCGPGVGVNIPRSEMPQIESHDVGDFLNYAREQGVAVSGHRVPAESLSPTQAQFRQERVDALPASSLAIPLFVSSDDYILDGTHRWVKHWQGDPQAQVPVYRLNLPLPAALEVMRAYPNSVTVDNSFCATGPGGGVNPSCSPTVSNPAGVGRKSSVREHLPAVTATKGAKPQVTVPPRPTISPVHEQTTKGGAKIREIHLPHRYDAEFEANGATYDFGAEKRHDPRGAYWYIAFARKTGLGGTYKVTGTAGTQAVRIMRNIGGIMERFVEKYSPDKFKFTADGNEPSRVKLYTRFATAFAASKGYDLETHGHQVHIQDKGPTMHYTFTKKPEGI